MVHVTAPKYRELLPQPYHGNIELFTKEDILPLELRFLPYDVNSVMHFGYRDYSKNGHRTIIFKDPSVQQKRVGLTDTDLKKIEIVYGPECRARDRQEKVDLCQSYPGVARRRRQSDDNTLDDKEPTLEPVERKKREIDIEIMATKSLRVNPDITPPPVTQSEDVTKTLVELGINDAVNTIVEEVYKVSSLALKNARVKYCNNDNKDKQPGEVKVAREGEDVKAKNSSDILGIIEVVADFAKGMVDHAIQNLTKFCENSEALEVYQRFSCGGSGGRDPRCRNSYRSTKSGAVKYSTNHRPIIEQSTNHKGGYKAKKNYGRQGNSTDDTGELTTLSVRRKRDLETTTVMPNDKEESKTTDGNKAVEERLMKATADKVAELKNKEVSDTQTVKEFKEKSTDENKEKSIKIENDDIKVKAKGKLMIDNKEILRMGTQLPGLDRNRYNRRSQGDDSEHTDSAEDLDALDAILAKKIIQKKHIVQKNIRKKKRNEEEAIDETIPKIKEKKRHQKKRKVDKHMAIPIEAYVKNYDSEQNGEKTKVNLDTSKEENNEEKPVAINKGKRRPINKAKKKNLFKKDESDAEENTMKEIDDEVRAPIRHKKKKPSLDLDGPRDLPRTVMLSKKNKDFYNERRWPHGELVYMIQVDTTYDLSDMRSRLREVSDILKEKTCVRMKEIKPGEANKYEDYIFIDNSPDYVTGRVGGKQKFGSIELFRGSQHRQHAAMMVMAMLGFYFEVSRHDRDKFIRVHMRHARPDKLHHFEMIRSDATLPVPYDYASATHPAWQFWRQMGRSGISTVATYKEKDPDGSIMKTLGQNENVLSDLDIVKINSVYGVDCFKHNASSD